MKRHRVKAHDHSDTQYEVFDNQNDIPLAATPNFKPRTENCVEAQVLEGDTLQAISLRFNCTIAELKRLNKIDKDNEIYARKHIKVPLTPHTLLLEALPTVHKSGNNSPKASQANTHGQSAHHLTSLLPKSELDEKLLLASVNASSFQQAYDPLEGSSRSPTIRYTKTNGTPASVTQPLLSDILDDDDHIPRMRILKQPRNDFSFNGSDCDISWICLLICILALCFLIPLIYVLYIAEHPEKFEKHHLNLTHQPHFES